MKLCCDCGYMDSDHGGDWDALVCRKDHFSGVASVELIKDNIRRAETCPDYTEEFVPHPEYTAYGIPVVGYYGQIK